LLQYADVRDVGKAAKDFPELNFIIYHSGFRFTGALKKRARISLTKLGASIGSPTWPTSRKSTA
jgi:predicted TIM-barrel fold metal-dependent hydrolase